MTKYFIAYVATAVVFVAVDYVWLVLIMRNFYKAQLGPLLLVNPNMAVAGAF